MRRLLDVWSRFAPSLCSRRRAWRRTSRPHPRLLPQPCGTGGACGRTAAAPAAAAPAAAPAAAAPYSQQGRHRLDDHRHRIRHPDDDPGPGAVLRRHGAHQEHAVDADAGVRRPSALLSVLWVIYGYSIAFTEGNALLRRLQSTVPERRDARLDGGHVQQGRGHSRVHLHRVPAARSRRSRRA